MVEYFREMIALKVYDQFYSKMINFVDKIGSEQQIIEPNTHQKEQQISMIIKYLADHVLQETNFYCQKKSKLSKDDGHDVNELRNMMIKINSSPSLRIQNLFQP